MEFFFIEYSDSQRKQYINAEHTYIRYLEQYKRYHSHYKYSMFWEKDRLVKKRSRDNKKEYLGKRDTQTENIYKLFIEGKEKSKEILRLSKEELKIQEKFNKFYKLNRTPVALIKIFQKLNRLDMDEKIIVIGTNSLYAYESYCGVFIEEKHLATFDIDLLSRKNKKVSFFFKEQLPDIKITDFIKSIDSSFVLNPKVPYRFENRDGVIVEVINPISSSINLKSDSFTDIIPLDMEGMQWLESTRLFKSLIIGENGQVAYLQTINPLDFAIYKLWLSQKRDREPIKRDRDLKQVRLVTKLIDEYILDIDITKQLEESRHFSKDVVEKYKEYRNEQKL